MSIRIESVCKRFGDYVALDQVDLDIGSGELIALLGPSGGGKTTLLRVIAGLEFPDCGRVLFEGSDATAAHPRDRHVGFVFQHYALFRHMSVFENIAFGLRVRPRRDRPNEAAIRQRVQELLELIQLDSFASRYPHELSGGQRQRVALARALAVEPKILLLDEPFGALDAKVRKELRRWLRRLHDEVRATTLFVTHDQEEAMEVADRIVVVNRGRIEQVGSPDEVYERPATPFVYEFLGDANRFRGGHAGSWNGLPEAGNSAFARPHEIDMFRVQPPEGGIAARVLQIATVGPRLRVDLEAQEAEKTIEVHLPRERCAQLKLAAGETVYLLPRALRTFQDTTRLRVAGEIS